MELRQKGKKFEHVVNNPTQGDLVSLLGQSLVGSALTAIFVCVSQVCHILKPFGNIFKDSPQNILINLSYLQKHQKKHFVYIGSSQCTTKQACPGVWGDILQADHGQD